jgi:hypothetical protein
LGWRREPVVGADGEGQALFLEQPDKGFDDRRLLRRFKGSKKMDHPFATNPPRSGPSSRELTNLVVTIEIHGDWLALGA